MTMRELIQRCSARLRFLRAGFTLIETMAAIALLMLAILPPMELASQSLTAAYYSRDQITASYLAQEGIEIVRAVRDGNIIAIAQGNSSVNIFDHIPYGTTAANAPLFTVDSTQVTTSAIDECQNNVCPPLQTNGTVYAYWPSCEPSPGGNGYGIWTTTDCAPGSNSSGWTDTNFTRSIKAYLLNSSNQDELRVSVTVVWKQGLFQNQSVTINEDLYRWVNN